MDHSRLPPPPAHLLDDLESIRDLLEGDLEPPLLTDTVDADAIPVLSDVVAPPPADAHPLAEPAPEPPLAAAPAAMPDVPAFEATRQNAERARLDSELRAAAQLILQDVIDDFVPQIEAELTRRLQARLGRLLPPRKD